MKSNYPFRIFTLIFYFSFYLFSQDIYSQNKGSIHPLHCMQGQFCNRHIHNSSVTNQQNELMESNIEHEFTHDIAFVLRGFDGSCEACDTFSYHMQAKKITEYLGHLSFGKVKTFKIFMNGLDERSPDFMQGIRDIEVLQASLDGWPGPTWDWLRNLTDYWKVVPTQYRPIITNAIEWIKTNKSNFANWGTLTSEGRTHYQIIQTNVQRMGSSAAADYLKDLRMPQGYNPRDFRVTLIILNTAGSTQIAGGGLQAGFEYFGLLDPKGIPYKWNTDGIGNNVAYVGTPLASTRAYTTTIHEAIHAFGMGTHDQDPNDLAIDYSIMYRSNISSFNTLPAWNRYFWCKWLPFSTITTNPAEVSDIKNRTNAEDANLKYILEVVKGDEFGRGGTYREKYDGKWYTYKVDQGGTLTFVDKLDKIHIKPTNYIDAIPEVIMENKKAKFQIFNDGEQEWSYQWFKNGVSIPNATKDTLIFQSVKRSDEGLYSVRISNSSGTITTQPVKVKVLCATGPQTLQGQQLKYCLNASVAPLNIKADAENTLLWYATDTTSIASTTPPVISTNKTGLRQYFVSQTNSLGCESLKSPITVKVNELPTKPITLNIEGCQFGTLSPLNVSFDPSNTLMWYSSDTAKVGSSTAPLLSSQEAGIKQYFVSQKNSLGCESPKSTITVNVKPAPSAPITENVEFCQRTPITDPKITIDAGNTLLWYFSEFSTSGMESRPFVSNQQVGITEFFVTQTNALGCVSAKKQVLITVKPTPSAPITETNEFCQFATNTPLKVNYDKNNSLLWYADVTATGSPTEPAISTQQYGIPRQIFVTQTNGQGCESPKSGFFVQIKYTPQAPFVHFKSELCQNEEVTPLRVDASPSNQITWYSSDTTKQGTTLIPTISSSQPGNFQYFVTETSNVGCESAKTEVKINVKPSPPIPILSLVNNVEIKSSASKNRWFRNGQLLSDTLQIIKPTMSGNYTARALDNNCQSAPSQALNFMITGLEDEFLKNFTLKPNPFNDIISIDYAVDGRIIDRVDFITLTGKVVKSQNTVASGTLINVEDLPIGIYFLRVNFDDISYSPILKVVKY